jgi:hypothetical protein
MVTNPGWREDGTRMIQGPIMRKTAAWILRAVKNSRMVAIFEKPLAKSISAFFHFQPDNG